MPKKSHSQPGLFENRAVNAWLNVAYQFQGRRPDRVATLKDRGHSLVYRLDGAAERRTAVIAKHCNLNTAEIEISAYKNVLMRLPIPALRYYGAFRDDIESSHNCCWLFMEDAGDEWYTFSTHHRALAGCWLAAIYSGSANLPVPENLPKKAPRWYLSELLLLRKSIERSFPNPALTDRDRRDLERILAQCRLLEANWDDVMSCCDGLPQGLVHGDLSPKNMRLRSCRGRESLFALDWETASWGVPAIDLASLTADLGAYRSALPPSFANIDALAALLLPGQIFRLICCMLWEAESLPGEWPVRAMRRMTLYQSRLAECIRAAGWEA